jgi:hypothetical protein
LGKELGGCEFPRRGIDTQVPLLEQLNEQSVGVPFRTVHRSPELASFAAGGVAAEVDHDGPGTLPTLADVTLHEADLLVAL